MSGSRKRNPYRGSRAFDVTCRSHGGCPYCANGRLHSVRKSSAIVGYEDSAYAEKLAELERSALDARSAEIMDANAEDEARYLDDMSIRDEMREMFGSERDDEDNYRRRTEST